MTTRRNGMRKGREWEAAIAAYLADNGFPDAERRRLAGVQDRGDIAGVPGVMIEAKNEAAPSVGIYMAEVVKQTKNAKAYVGVAWLKRPGASDAGRGIVLVHEDMLPRLGFMGDIVDLQARLGDLLASEAVFAPTPTPRVLLVRRNAPYLSTPIYAMSGAMFVGLIRPVGAA